MYRREPITTTVAQSDYFWAIWRDLYPHQDDAKTPREVVECVIECVAWYWENASEEDGCFLKGTGYTLDQFRTWAHVRRVTLMGQAFHLFHTDEEAA